MDYVFGYGSILDDFDPDDPDVMLANLTSIYERSFCFRSTTGFTAAGVVPSKSNLNTTICGVLFPVGIRQDTTNKDKSKDKIKDTTTGDVSDIDIDYIANSTTSLKALDIREKGYKRVQVNTSNLSSCNSHCIDATADKCWIYVPIDPQEATKDFPICQTYVDTILRGCLKWGGIDLATQWIHETTGWSSFFLNDAPLSRRPWLHRQHFSEIDQVLEAAATHTFYHERRHPEEFSAHWLSNLRGFWGIPPRNPHFIGRELELGKIMEVLQSSSSKNGIGNNHNHVGITMIETVGLGGVGKTQVASEYCHRHYSTYYGLIMWWRSETPEVLAADVRRFAEDTGIVVNGVRNEEVVREVLARLYQTTKPWLMVLDNLTDKSTLDTYLPRGTGHAGGHILVTSREFLQGFDQNNCVELRCFDMHESLDLLRRVGGEHLDIDEPYDSSRNGGNGSNSGGGNGGGGGGGGSGNSNTKYVEISNTTESKPKTAGEVLCVRLGHLPLALSVASAYMRQCDVDASSYLHLLDQGTTSAIDNSSNGERLLLGYPMGVEESLSLSLLRLREKEEEMGDGAVSSRDVLDVLAYLYPDDISKDIVASVVACLSVEANTDIRSTSKSSMSSVSSVSSMSSLLLPVGVGVCTCLAMVGIATNRNDKTRATTLLAISGTIAIGSMAVPLLLWQQSSKQNDSTAQTFYHPLQSLTLQQNHQNTKGINKNKNENNGRLTNRVWMKLKKYSLLTVQRGHGSMHRLLQQLLRQGRHNSVRTLSTSIYAILQRWSFDPADPTTWKSAGAVVDHMRIVGQHVLDLLKNFRKKSHEGSHAILLSELQIKTSELLTESALYMSMALSRFPEARTVLEVAMDIQKTSNKIKSKRLLASMAKTLHAAGKVSRYCGRYEESNTFLNAAIALRGGRTAQTYDVAADLHELGVLMIKRGKWSKAQILLKDSLSVQRVLDAKNANKIQKSNNNNNNDNFRTTTRFCNVSATLHQLAVVAMNIKPRRLDVAETLLQESLSSMLGGRAGGRAATLQKLAQVLERSGKRKNAERYLKEALRLYEDIYGNDVPHVNIAAVLTNLGENAFGGKKYDEARTLLKKSLRMRERMYGQSVDVWSGVAGVELGLNLSKLGEVERAQNQWTKAKEYFVRAGQAFLRLLLRERGSSSHGMKEMNETDAIHLLSLQLKTVAIPATTFEKRLVRLCVSAWRWQLKVARTRSSNANVDCDEQNVEIKEIEENLEILKAIQVMSWMLEEKIMKLNDTDGNVKDMDGSGVQVQKVSLIAHQEFCRQLATCRASVRSMLTSKDSTQTVVVKLKEMKIVVNGFGATISKNEDDDVEIAETRRAARKFVEVVVSTIETFNADPTKMNEKQVKGVIFGATDDIRDTLRKCGIDVMD